MYEREYYNLKRDDTVRYLVFCCCPMSSMLLDNIIINLDGGLRQYK